eukprot:sb/3469635/
MFHGFPSDPTLAEQWVINTGRLPGDVVTKTMRVCSDHFTEDDYTHDSIISFRCSGEKSKLELRPDAVPIQGREALEVGSDGLVVGKRRRLNQTSFTGPVSTEQQPFVDLKDENLTTILNRSDDKKPTQAAAVSTAGPDPLANLIKQIHLIKEMFPGGDTTTAAVPGVGGDAAKKVAEIEALDKLLTELKNTTSSPNNSLLGHHVTLLIRASRDTPYHHVTLLIIT